MEFDLPPEMRFEPRLNQRFLTTRINSGRQTSIHPTELHTRQHKKSIEIWLDHHTPSYICLKTPQNSTGSTGTRIYTHRVRHPESAHVRNKYLQKMKKKKERNHWNSCETSSRPTRCLSYNKLATAIFNVTIFPFYSCGPTTRHTFKTNWAWPPIRHHTVKPTFKSGTIAGKTLDRNTLN